MDEREWGARFGRDVDVLLRGGEPATDSAPPEYGELLAVARMLAAPDPRAGSVIREPLRRRLVAEAARSGAAPAPRTWRVLGLAPQQIAVLLPLAVLTLLAVGLLALVVERAWPRGGPGTMGALALTASPTLAQQMLEPSPREIATPRLAPSASSTPVPAPTAGSPVASAAVARPAVRTLAVGPTEAHTATGVPTGLPPTSDLR